MPLDKENSLWREARYQRQQDSRSRSDFSNDHLEHALRSGRCGCYPDGSWGAACLINNTDTTIGTIASMVTAAATREPVLALGSLRDMNHLALAAPMARYDGRRYVLVGRSHWQASYRLSISPWSSASDHRSLGSVERRRRGRLRTEGDATADID